jgi:hypothetical protein
LTRKLRNQSTFGILGGEVDVFGAEAYAYEAGGDAAEVGETLEQFEEPRQGQRLGAG